MANIYKKKYLYVRYVRKRNGNEILSGKDNKIIFEINALMDKINKLFRIIS